MFARLNCVLTISIMVEDLMSMMRDMMENAGLICDSQTSN